MEQVLREMIDQLQAYGWTPHGTKDLNGRWCSWKSDEAYERSLWSVIQYKCTSALQVQNVCELLRDCIDTLHGIHNTNPVKGVKNWSTYSTRTQDDILQLLMWAADEAFFMENPGLKNVFNQIREVHRECDADRFFQLTQIVRRRLG